MVAGVVPALADAPVLGAALLVLVALVEVVVVTAAEALPGAVVGTVKPGAPRKR